MFSRHNALPRQPETQSLATLGVAEALAARLEQIANIKDTYGREEMRKTRFVTDFFSAQNVSFFKTIPLLTTAEVGNSGSSPYDELAKRSLASALDHKETDGKVQLLGSNVIVRRFTELTNGTPNQRGLVAEEAVVAERAAMYTGGIATALWKLGFVEFGSEQGFPNGRGKFNHSITVNEARQGKALIKSMCLPFDATNELHMMLASKMGESAPEFIQVEIANTPYPDPKSWYTLPSMSLRLLGHPTTEPHGAVNNSQ